MKIVRPLKKASGINTVLTSLLKGRKDLAQHFPLKDAPGNENQENRTSHSCQFDTQAIAWGTRKGILCQLVQGFKDKDHYLEANQ